MFKNLKFFGKSRPSSTSKTEEKDAWQQLKVYQVFPPEEIPREFKTFSSLICEQLKEYGFQKRESKTNKWIYRQTEDFEQAILLDNSSRWASNRKEFEIDICITPLYHDRKTNYRIVRAFELNPAFKMGYDLTREYPLLVDHLEKRFREFVLPFFDTYSTSKVVIAKRSRLTSLVRPQTNDALQLHSDMTKLLYDCAFRQRDATLFNELHALELRESIRLEKAFVSDTKYAQIYADKVLEVEKRKQTFDDDELFKQEILLQD